MKSLRSFVACNCIWVVAVAIFTGCSTPTPHSVGTGPSFKGPVGLQLYSLRANFTRNVPASLDMVRAYGIHDVELAATYNLPPAQFRSMLTERGLRAVSAHFPYDRLRDDPESVAREAKALGVRWAGTAWIPHEGSFDAEEARAAARVLNRAGEILAREGIRCFYHCHGYEFEAGAAGPTTAMDILITETHPHHVSFEMDILWVFFPGQDPAHWLLKYPGRWELMHLKDLKKGVARGSNSGGTDPNNDVVLGTGQMDWPRVLHAAKKSGVKYYFIEDESADAANQIPQTLKFLETVRF